MTIIKTNFLERLAEVTKNNEEEKMKVGNEVIERHLKKETLQGRQIPTVEISVAEFKVFYKDWGYKHD